MFLYGKIKVSFCAEEDRFMEFVRDAFPSMKIVWVEVDEEVEIITYYFYDSKRCHATIFEYASAELVRRYLITITRFELPEGSIKEMVDAGCFVENVVTSQDHDGLFLIKMEKAK